MVLYYAAHKNSLYSRINWDVALEQYKSKQEILIAIMPIGTIGNFSGELALKATSLIKNSFALVNEAERMGSNQIIQKEENKLIQEFLRGNTNPGIGTKNLFKDINYLRGKTGAMETLGKSSKANEQKVIDIIKELYK